MNISTISVFLILVEGMQSLNRYLKKAVFFISKHYNFILWFNNWLSGKTYSCTINYQQAKNNLHQNYLKSNHYGLKSAFIFSMSTATSAKVWKSNEILTKREWSEMIEKSWINPDKWLQYLPLLLKGISVSHSAEGQISILSSNHA